MSTPDAIPAALALDGLRGDARAAFDLAASTGYAGVAVATNHPELNPNILGASGRRHVKTLLSGKRLGLASIRAAAPRAGLTDPATIDRTMDNTRKAMLLARDMGVHTVALHLGTLAQDMKGVPQGTVISALRELAQQADVSGVTLAIGAESADGTTGPSLAQILKDVDFDGARALLDTGRAIASGDDPLKAAELLATISAHGGLGQVTAADAVRAGAKVRAAALGEGQLPVGDLLELLRDMGFAGPLVVDVRDVPDTTQAAAHAVALLRGLLRR